MAASPSLVSWSFLGYGLLVIGMIATLFSSRRYLLGYWLSGMVYWLIVDSIETLLVITVKLTSGQSYGIAFVLTSLIFSALLYGYYRRHQRLSSSSNLSHIAHPQTSYIEHTPIYNNYTPRFRPSSSLHSHNP